jgi:hypothetical protein
MDMYKTQLQPFVQLSRLSTSLWRVVKIIITSDSTPVDSLPLALVIKYVIEA